MLVILKVQAIDTETMIPEGPDIALDFLRMKFDGIEDVYGIVLYHEEEPGCPGHVIFVGGTKEHTEEELLVAARDQYEVNGGLARHGAMYVDPRDDTLHTFGEPVA